MAYYLKKTKLKGRTYLSIDESFYSHDKKGAVHKCYQSLGSVETLKNKGMEDPISYYQKEVDALNQQRKNAGSRKISELSPDLYLGYFPLRAIMKKMKIEHYINYFNLSYDFRYNLYEVLSALIYARSVNPCSKHKTFHDVLPNLYHPPGYSYDQLLDALAFPGENYQKIIEIFTVQTKSLFGIDTSKTCFDCTNFYFEIDREDDFRRKGLSKENKREPIVGLGLLLDRNQIPVGMRMYPGNESEKPVLREVIDSLKSKNNLSGKTIHVADKGLNCARNIAFSKLNGDGYLFSKSVKTLPGTEKTWVLLKQDYKEMRDGKGKLLYLYKSCTDKFPYVIEQDGKNRTVLLTEKRLVTYNPSLASKKRYEINRLVEKAKSLTLSQAKKNDFGESGKYVNFTDKEGKKAKTSINQDAIDKDLSLAGYSLLVTSETKMTDQDIYNTCHNLWRIEESFKIMKSDLDARPAFLQREESIKGHFLICYLTVLLERIFQFKIMGAQHSTSDVFKFIKGFKVTKGEYRYINTTRDSVFINALEKQFHLPLTSYFLSDTQIQSIFNYKL